jgi:hypothetical protein
MRPAHVGLYRDIAILSYATREALHAIRISNGRIAQIGIARAVDRPRIGPAGVVYQDDLDVAKHRTAPAERTLKLVPLAAVREELGRPFSTVRKYMSYSTPPRPATVASGSRPPAASAPRYRGADPPLPFVGAPITAVSMDGPRVALAVRDPQGRCDYVLFWNVLWHYVTRLTRAVGQTCLPVHGPGGITDVAIAGSRAVWTVTYSGETRVLAATITDCQEWVVARPAAGERVALAGGGGVLAYATASRRQERPEVSDIGVVPSFWEGASIGRIPSRVIELSVDGDRVAALDGRGNVSIRTRRGEPTAQFNVGRARALALRGVAVAVLRDGAVDVYSVATGARTHSWTVPAEAASVDLHYGIAVITAARDVYALNIETGRIARIFRGPSRVFAQVEAPGAAIAFTAAGRGSLRFIPMSRLEASIR